MNLLEDEWLTVLRRNGDREKLQGLWRIVDGVESDNPIVDIVSPRADFKGGLYQFFIGLLQTTWAPKNSRKWRASWLNPPDQETLKQAFLSVKDAFVLDSSDSAFMQDYELLADKKPIGIASLLIDTSGGGTFFIKEGTTNGMTPYWAMIALYTLQINAPAGGVGHRTGMRGGGPLTTLVMPDETEQPASLWRKLWLNVLTQQELESATEFSSSEELAHTFPWLDKTRTSEAGSKTLETHPIHAHPYQVYWSMPRRIRLDFDSKQSGHCDISHEYAENLVSRYRTQNYGVNYSSAWLHPLTPYVRDPKKEPYSVKAQPGGFCYRHWLGLVLDDDKNHKQAAKIVRIYLDSRQALIEGEYQPRLWLFGYDMDNMKARCWYETVMPIFPIAPEQRAVLQQHIGKLIDAATETAADVRSTLKQAWFSRPKEVKGDVSFIDSQFWQNTEADFYRLLHLFIEHGDDDDRVKRFFAEWHRILRDQALSLFDYWALSSNNEDGDVKRTVKARISLEKWLHSGKHLKQLVA